MSDAFPPPPPGPQPSAPPPPPAPHPQALPPAIPPAARRIYLRAQLAGAAYSIGVGALGILLPLITSAFFGGNVVYLYVLPLFGVIYGVRSMTRGFVVGGLIGVVLNLLAGMASLRAAGLFPPGG